MSKVRRYWREMQLAWRLGVDLSSRVRLVWATLHFHLRVGLRRLPPPNETANTYHLNLGGHRAEIHLRTCSGDLFILYEIFLDDCYRLPPQVGHVESVVDLGANIGLTTLYYARQFPDARFVCVEPLPANVALLRANTAMLGERVQIVQGAVSDCAGTLTFAPSPWSWGGKADAAASQPLNVRAYTLPEILQVAKLERIDLLKVDVEGAERALFSNSSAWLERVNAIIIELHDNYALTTFGEAVAPYGLRAIPPTEAFGNAMVLALRERS